jgi:hypothetical protein
VRLSRSEFVRRLVLNSISDDFENVDQVILRDVAEDAAKCGFTVERPEVVEALAGLIADGFAKAYILSGDSRDPFSGELPGMPPMGVIEEYFKTYFYITKAGLDLHNRQRCDGTWPFDDLGDLRQDWRLTADSTL